MSEAWMIHIVDDDEPVRKALSFVLEAVGYFVATYADAAAFLQYEAGERNLLICDVRMLGMSGIELTGLLRQGGSTMPIILVTGHASKEMRMEAMSAGAQTVLEKPVAVDVLLAEISRVTAGTS